LKPVTNWRDRRESSCVAVLAVAALR
jgi:hypothetical protein